MKNRTLYSLIFLFTISCKTAVDVAPDNLIGSWAHMGSTGSVKYAGNTYSLNSKATGETMTFQKDGICEYGNFNKYTVKGTTITFSSTTANDKEEATFSIVKDVLALVQNTEQARKYVSDPDKIEFWDYKASFDKKTTTTVGQPNSTRGFGEFTTPNGTEKGICISYEHINGCKENVSIWMRNTNQISGSPTSSVFFDQMPLANSGTFEFKDSYIIGGNTCKSTGSYQYIDKAGRQTDYTIISGTLTKISRESFSFQCKARHDTNKSIIDISGKGICKPHTEF